jgi:hypothetical protein
LSSDEIIALHQVPCSVSLRGISTVLIVLAHGMAWHFVAKMESEIPMQQSPKSQRAYSMSRVYATIPFI